MPYCKRSADNINFVFRFSCPQTSDFTDIGDWPTLGAAVAASRCHSTPPHDGDSSHHNGNAVRTNFSILCSNPTREVSVLQKSLALSVD